MSRIVASSLAGAFALLAAASASAQTAPGGRGMEGPQTLEAMQARQDRLFDRLDADRDDAVTAAELAGLSQIMPRGSGRMWAMIARADANNDARITRDEMRAAGEARFHQMDRNGDGVIGPDERPQTPPQAGTAIPMPQGDNPADPGQWPGGVPDGG